MNIELTNSSENINKELAYLFGVYLTDANIKKSGEFQLQVIDKDFAEITLKYIKKIKPSCKANIFERKEGIRKWKNGKISKEQKRYCVSAGLANLKEFFEKQTNCKHHLPFFIWSAPLQIKKWFIAGIMDGDGYISIYNNGNYKGKKYKKYDIGVGKAEEGWILEFKDFLQKMGIKMRKETRYMTENGVVMIQLRFVSGEFIKNGLFFTKKNSIISERSETRRCTSYGMKI